MERSNAIPSDGQSGGDGIDAYPGVNSGGSPEGWAGQFFGDVAIWIALYASAKYFKIDHQLYPARKYLVHASIESSEMMNVYIRRTRRVRRLFNCPVGLRLSTAIFATS